jgi:phosphohistidine swiveling domain-containing protein
MPARPVINTPDIDDYELTFKVSGLSFLFTDMLVNGFTYFDPLFASSPRRDFYQYYKNEKVTKALRYGIRWLSKPNGFEEYHKIFSEYYRTNFKVLNKIIVAEKLSPSSVQNFFKILSTIFLFDTRLDNKFTDSAYLHTKNNSTLKKNLELLGKFKNVSRLWINQTFLEEENPLSRFIDKLGRQFSLERSEVENYKITELLQLFDDKRVPHNEIGNRRLSYTIYYSKGQKFYLTGKESGDFIAKIQSKENVPRTSEIKGQVANKRGKVVSGKVRVINVDYGNLKKLNAQMSAMKRGEILVAEFTAPELMVACRKAKAIITDLGGLLSHAAIISRELGVPCIIGTKFATKVLKDGDLVEVDAERGIVRKLS